MNAAADFTLPPDEVAASAAWAHLGPGLRVETVDPGRLWRVGTTIPFGPLRLRTAMTVIRLADGTLFVHSPLAPTRDLTRALDTLGRVAYAVAPNRSHHLYFAKFLRRYPRAQAFVAPGLAEKEPLFNHFDALGPGVVAPWAGELPSVFVEGLPVLNETVWYDPPSRTLVVTDLLFCIAHPENRAARVATTLLGVRARLAMSWTMRLAVRDRAAFARSVAAIRAFDFARISLAHDCVVERDAVRAFDAAVGWALPRRAA